MKDFILFAMIGLILGKLSSQEEIAIYLIIFVIFIAVTIYRAYENDSLDKYRSSLE